MEFICYSRLHETECPKNYTRHGFKPQPRVCVVGEYENGTLKLAASRCSLKDRFVRKKGRELAKKRLKNNKHIVTYKINNIDSQIFHELADIIINNVRKDPKMVEPK